MRRPSDTRARSDLGSRTQYIVTLHPGFRPWVGLWGRSMLRPYDARVLRAYDARPQLRLGARDSIANDHDSVYVIGHYDERIEGDARLMIRDRVPRPAHRVTKLRQSQASLGDFGKQSTSLMSADGDEVRATAPIVVGWKAIRPSADAAAAEAGAIGGAGHAGE